MLSKKWAWSWLSRQVMLATVYNAKCISKISVHMCFGKLTWNLFTTHFAAVQWEYCFGNGVLQRAGRLQEVPWVGCNISIHKIEQVRLPELSEASPCSIQRSRTHCCENPIVSYEVPFLYYRWSIIVFQVLKESIEWLDNWDKYIQTLPTQRQVCFLTKQTCAALRITLHSAVALIESLLSSGFNYVLVGHFGQDPLEVNTTIFMCMSSLCLLFAINWSFLCRGFSASSGMLLVMEGSQPCNIFCSYIGCSLWAWFGHQNVPQSREMDHSSCSSSRASSTRKNLTGE